MVGQGKQMTDTSSRNKKKYTLKHELSAAGAQSKRDWQKFRLRTRKNPTQNKKNPTRKNFSECGWCPAQAVHKEKKRKSKTRPSMKMIVSSEASLFEKGALQGEPRSET
mmetsp:Transcript_12747/g.21975  ORF Transcript_12747/g.21975 Transcript_12747/m.21975 type:complete len:109 (-) Transcript_12747:234-560(-)